MTKITLDMLKEDYWRDMSTSQLITLRRAIDVDTENFRRGMRGLHTVEDYARGVPELTVRMNAINSLTELISQRAPTYIPKKSLNDPCGHCPKCWKEVVIDCALSWDALYLFGMVRGIKIINLYCRQCKGIRWRRT